MSGLFEKHKMPWRSKKRGDGYWYIEDANGHAVASIATSCKNHAKQAATELEPDYETARLALRATEALGYLDGMPENGVGRRFDDCIDGGDITENIKGYIIHLENELGITAK